MSDNLFLATWIGLIVAFWIGLYYFDKWRKSRSDVVGSAKSLFLESMPSARAVPLRAVVVVEGDQIAPSSLNRR